MSGFKEKRMTDTMNENFSIERMARRIRELADLGQNSTAGMRALLEEFPEASLYKWGCAFCMALASLGDKRLLPHSCGPAEADDGGEPADCELVEIADALNYAHSANADRCNFAMLALNLSSALRELWTQNGLKSEEELPKILNPVEMTVLEDCRAFELPF